MYWIVPVCGCTHDRACTEVRRQLTGNSSLPPPSGPWTLNSGVQPLMTYVGLFLEIWLLSHGLCYVDTQVSPVYSSWGLLCCLHLHQINRVWGIVFLRCFVVSGVTGVLSLLSPPLPSLLPSPPLSFQIAQAGLELLPDPLASTILGSGIPGTFIVHRYTPSTCTHKMDKN